MSRTRALLFKSFILVAGAVLAAAGAFAQPVSRQVKWKEPAVKSLEKITNEKVLSFEGAFYLHNDMPQYIERFPIASASAHATAAISNLQFEPLKDAALIKDANAINKDIVLKTEVVFEKKKAFLQVSFIPIKKNGSSFERLVSFDIAVNSQGGGGAVNRNANRYSASTSVLASGTWYRIGVTNDGVYKLTYQQLKDLGLSVDALNPQNIRIYGNGGGMLPFANNIFRYDDLQENAIYISGENDGKFDKSDYVLFYGQSPHRWTYSTCDNRFHHQVNWYSDTTYYFITADLGQGKRIQSQASTSAPANATVTTFDDYAYHEVDAVNWLKSGREWMGEVFDETNSSYSFQFSFPNHTDSIYIRSDVWARSLGAGHQAHFDLSVNGGLIVSQYVPIAPDAYFQAYAYSTSTETTSCGYGTPKTFVSGSDLLNVNLKFIPHPGYVQAQGWLNFIELNARRQLTMNPGINQLNFRNVAASGMGTIADYNLAGATASTQVWDVTDPINVANVQALSNSGGMFNFRIPADSLKQFISFNGSVYYSPSLAGKVDNQNLHGLPLTDMVIVAHPNFMTAALRLAKFHRDHDALSVQVVTPQQIYNEFSSGAQDVTAIRDFMKMFYDRAANANDAPKYLLMFGRGSYDPKYRLPNNTNYIVAYESMNSNEPTLSYMSDDFFTFLDDSEGNWDAGTNLMDVSVGRLPVKTAAEAEAMVDKIIHYASPELGTTAVQACNSGASSSFGDWRNIVAFVADDEDSDIHMLQAETLQGMVANVYKDYNIDKIYMDSYKQVATPGGDRYPDGRDAIVKRVQRGCLFLDFIGHGGPVGWTEERILEMDDINGWTNYDRLPAFITATCEFSTADDPSISSAGESVLLNPKGGGISLFTTCRLAYSAANFELGKKFFTHIFNPINGNMPRMGDICALTKNDYPSVSTRNFILLGDPALMLNYPKWNVTTTMIDGDSVSSVSVPDTIRALQKVTIKGFVDDGNGQKLTNFNGVIYPTVYDKSVTYRTLANDPSSYVTNFQLQKSILYKGAATVVNGDFTFTFVVPKDISYKYGFGRLSYYANDQTTDANGYFENFIIGGANSNAAADNKGPVIRLFMNDSSFVYGGLTNQSPSLYARIIDSSGVSTVGNGIGHDITAQLDDDNGKIYVLNDYYQADLNSYQSGKVVYPFTGLSEGVHTVKFKVWDVYNNSSEARLEFVVASDSKLALTHVLNYPNPFTTSTRFFFEHNKPCMPMVVQVQIYTVAGKLIKTIRKDVECNGFRSDEITWDGLDDYGDRIGRGVYVYRLKVHAPDGSEAEKFEKLVVLR